MYNVNKSLKKASQFNLPPQPKIVPEIGLSSKSIEELQTMLEAALEDEDYELADKIQQELRRR
jgi:protein-arginine kinase activator protein McsA